MNLKEFIALLFENDTEPSTAQLLQERLDAILAIKDDPITLKETITPASMVQILYEEAQQVAQQLFENEEEYRFLPGTVEATVIVNLETYTLLKAQEANFRKEVLFYVLSELLQNKEATIPETFRETLFCKILGTPLHFSDEEYIHFLAAWHDLKHYPDFIPFLIRKFKKMDTVGTTFLKYLIQFNTQRLHREEEYQEYTTLSDILARIIANHPNRNTASISPFYPLLPDHFGNSVNASIQRLTPIQQASFYRIFIHFITKPNQTPVQLHHAIQNDIQSIGESIYLNVLQLYSISASHFKPKVKIIQRETSYRGKFLVKDYQYMRMENISILKGMLSSIAYYGTMHKIEHIRVLIERSYTTSSLHRLGPTSRTLGKLCIQLLAHHFGDPGQEILKELHEFSSFKTIKKQIEAVSAACTPPFL